MRLTAVVACVLAGVSVANVANAACSDFFKFEPDAKLSVNAISKLGAPDDSAPTTPNGGSIVYWAFDREDYPARGEWAAYAVVYAASSQSYEWHPGGVIWAKWRGQDLYAAYDLKRAKIRGGVTLAVRQPSISKACPEGLVFKLTDGGVLSLNGQRIGQTRWE